MATLIMIFLLKKKSRSASGIFVQPKIDYLWLRQQTPALTLAKVKVKKEICKSLCHELNRYVFGCKSNRLL